MKSIVCWLQLSIAAGVLGCGPAGEGKLGEASFALSSVPNVNVTRKLLNQSEQASLRRARKRSAAEASARSIRSCAGSGCRRCWIAHSAS
jgi:hypothetical protein